MKGYVKIEFSEQFVDWLDRKVKNIGIEINKLDKMQINGEFDEVVKKFFLFKSKRQLRSSMRLAISEPSRWYICVVPRLFTNEVEFSSTRRFSDAVEILHAAKSSEDIYLDLQSCHAVNRILEEFKREES